MTTKFYRFISLFIVIIFFGACGTNKKDDDQTVESSPQAQTDITRPPVFIKRNQDNSETNPNETISLEEWQRQQDNRD